MNLVEPEEIARITKLDKFGMSNLAHLLMRITKLSKINKICNEHYNKAGIAFIDAILEGIGARYDYFEDELRNVPKTGPFVTISNHPLGGVDGLILLKLISSVRPDYKVMANFLLQRVEPIKYLFIPVNPFENHKDAQSSFSGIKGAVSCIKAGHGLGIFPAGEVSTIAVDDGKIKDKEWQDEAIRLIQKLAVPIVPVFFKAQNSRLFYALSMLSSTLQTVKLPSEIFQQKNKDILVRVGKTILPSELEFMSTEKANVFLRERTYRFANTIEKESRLRSISNRFKIKNNRAKQALAPPQDPEDVINEVESALKRGALLTEAKQFQVFLSKAKHIPCILCEIGRLRECTFRKVGEGTGNPYDLDEFDQFYQHLFLWDREEKRIVGAYRLGIGSDIYREKGIEGFYIKTLFEVEHNGHALFSNCLEMGRAFILEEYQKKTLPLHLLWKGIIHVILRKKKKIRFLVGCVAISNNFSKHSKAIMIEFVKRHFLDEDLAKFIRPKREYKVKFKALEKQLIDSTVPEDIDKLDKYISEIEPGNMRFPILLKKYIKQNAKIIAFNVDPKFNNSIDGLMYVDIKDLPEQTMKSVTEELETATNKATFKKM